MKILGRKISTFFPPFIRPWVRRIGLELARARLAALDALLAAGVRAGRGIVQVGGPTDFDFQPNQIIVLCKFRNGAPWLESFVSYYQKIGVDRIVLVDNGSTDGSRDIIRRYPAVSLFSTSLPHSRYWVPTKRWLIRNLGGGGCWCLMADVDELFDYPYSKRVRIHQFIEYLNAHRYTAVSVQNLEMVSKEPLLSIQGRTEENLEETYKFFDISQIRDDDRYWLKMNQIDSPDHHSHSGGVRASGFDWGGSMLTRHALVRNADGIRLYPYDSHFVTRARIADVSTVFKHYKFIGAFVTHMWDAIEHAQHHNRSRIFERYAAVLRENPDLTLAGSEAREYVAAEDLLDSGFLIASPRYREWAREGRLAEGR